MLTPRHDRQQDSQWHIIIISLNKKILVTLDITGLSSSLSIGIEVL